MNESQHIYEHEAFVERNVPKPDKLPVELRKKIELFARIKEKHPLTIGNDYQKLKHRLFLLDLEITEDLEEEFQTQILHNIESEPDQEIEKVQNLGNEYLLARLFDSGKQENLSKSKLMAMGLKLDYSTWEIHIGEYVLRRSEVFRYIYTLHKREPSTEGRSNIP